jgi:hypothetical protein
MKKLPMTKPTDVRPSWRPYSNSDPFRTRMDIGRSRTFHSPNDRNTGAPTMKIERRIGVLQRYLAPLFRFWATTPMEVGSAAAPFGTSTGRRRANATKYVMASM